MWSLDGRQRRLACKRHGDAERVHTYAAGSVEPGETLGTGMVAAWIILDEPSPVIATIAVELNTPKRGRLAVRRQAEVSVDMIKGYSKLDRNTFLAILDEAKQQNLKVVAHLPESAMSKVLRLRAVFYLLWQDGLGRGKVELLRFSDFYLTQCEQAKRLFVRDGNWHKGRPMYLTDVTLQALKPYLVVLGIEHAGDFVFFWQGRPLKKNFLSGRLKAVGRQLDVSVSPPQTYLWALVPMINSNHMLGHMYWFISYDWLKSIVK
jgi:hypothetical protein